jgi:preprotein translocase subunit YajC
MFSPFAAFLAQTAPAQSQPGGMGSLLVPLACFAVIFYFGILRPQKKKQDDQAKLLTALKTGDKVVTTGGIHGVVANVKDGPVLVLKIADNVKIEVDKSAIATIEGGASKDASAAKELPAKANA